MEFVSNKNCRKARTLQPCPGPGTAVSSGTHEGSKGLLWAGKGLWDLLVPPGPLHPHTSWLQGYPSSMALPA